MCVQTPPSMKITLPEKSSLLLKGSVRNNNLQHKIIFYLLATNCKAIKYDSTPTNAFQTRILFFKRETNVYCVEISYLLLNVISGLKCA